MPSKLAPELVTAAFRGTLASVEWVGSWKEESEKKRVPWKSGWLQGRMGSGRGKKSGQGPAEVWVGLLGIFIDGMSLVCREDLQ